MFLVIKIIHWVVVMYKLRVFSLLMLLICFLNFGLLKVKSEPVYTLVGGSCGLKFADSFFEIHTYQPIRTRHESCWNILTGSTAMTINIPPNMRDLSYKVELINETDSGSVEYSTSSPYGKSTILFEHNFVRSGKFTIVLTGEGNQKHYAARHSIIVMRDE